MIKPIVKDIKILSQKSEKCIVGVIGDDIPHLIEDMLDTAIAHKENCIGLSAVQIGEHLRVILVLINGVFVPFINPVIIKRGAKTYTATEGCLSLDGEKQVKRYKEILLNYTDLKGRTHTNRFSGRVAQIIQHEIDHLNGILI